MPVRAEPRDRGGLDEARRQARPRVIARVRILIDLAFPKAIVPLSDVTAPILDRFVEARVKRTLREGKGVIARREPKPQD